MGFMHAYLSSSSLFLLALTPYLSEPTSLHAHTLLDCSSSNHELCHHTALMMSHTLLDCSSWCPLLMLRLLPWHLPNGQQQHPSCTIEPQTVPSSGRRLTTACGKQHLLLFSNTVGVWCGWSEGGVGWFDARQATSVRLWLKSIGMCAVSNLTINSPFHLTPYLALLSPNTACSC
jgi:hypothetical protein